MLPDRVSNPGPLTYESGALPIALRGPAPTIGTVGFYSAVLCSKDANRITNREDPDQTAP